MTLNQLEGMTTREIVHEIGLRQKGKAGEWSINLTVLGIELQSRANIQQAESNENNERFFGENG